MSVQPMLFGAALSVLSVGLLAAMIRSDRDRHSRFSFVALVSDPKTKETSPARVVLIGAFIATTFVIMYQAFAHTLTDATFGAYMLGWVAPAVTKIITDAGIEKAANTPDPAPIAIDRVVNMNAGDAGAPPPVTSPPPAPEAPTPQRPKPPKEK